MRNTADLIGRAAIAIALMVAFHGLALAAVVVLIAVPFLLVRLSTGLAFKVGLFCAVGAFLILKAMLPRRDHFEPPGPRLEPGQQPRLFAEIRSLASATRQAPPAEVYLLPDVNAFVGQRGGLMGIGSRRVMGLGLPLLQVLTLPELRAVLAHEFGHLDRGDVALGPWIYSTRGALLRTIEDVHDHSPLLSLPFSWFAELFFRVTHAISRHQEVKADRLAAAVAGRAPLASGLRAVDAASLTFGPYWAGMVDPLLSAGFLPPLSAGFDAFAKAPWLADALQKHEQAQDPPSPFDTHPPLRERLAALGVGPDEARRPAGPYALALLEHLPELERRLAAIVARRGEGFASRSSEGLGLGRELPALTPIRWEEVGSRVWLPEWEKLTARNRRHLEGLTPAGLPGLDWPTLGQRLAAGSDEVPPLDAADNVVGCALAVAFARAGFAIDSTPGRSAALTSLDTRVEPFGIREQLANPPDARVAWQDLCRRAGVADVDLGSLGPNRT